MTAPRSASSEDYSVNNFSWSQGHKSVVIAARRVLGFILTLNYLVLWLPPIFLQGWAYNSFLHRFFRPVYDLADKSARLRSFAFRYIYRAQYLVDYFASAVFFLVGFLASLTLVFYWQIAFGVLPWWLIAVYYFCWVGFGGRSMGIAYSFAHREGHAAGEGLYRPWIRKSTGNIFGNWVGNFYGNVPYNFSTAHILLHHRLNGGKGDVIYMWDLDRTRFSDVLLYVWRIFVYMTGWSSLNVFAKQRHIPVMERAYRQLRKGMIIYWLILPLAITVVLGVSGSSPAAIGVFLFFIYFQALIAMAFFLAFINIGQHGFVECDADGKFISHVCSSTILDGKDDVFGENDHMAHHYFGQVSHDLLAEHQTSQRPLWGRHHASVFEKISIMELGISIVFKQFNKLARQHYVDFSGNLNTQQIAELLERRAKRKEIDYEDYEFGYLPNLKDTVGRLVRNNICSNEQQAYVYQAHRNHNCFS